MRYYEEIDTGLVLEAWSVAGTGSAPDTSNTYTATYDTPAKKDKADTLYAGVAALTTRINNL